MLLVLIVYSVAEVTLNYVEGEAFIMIMCQTSKEHGGVACIWLKGIKDNVGLWTYMTLQFINGFMWNKKWNEYIKLEWNEVECLRYLHQFLLLIL